jgi:putative membrane protein
MIGFATTVVATGLALWVTSLIYKDISFGSDPQVTTVLIVAAVFGLVNGVLKPLIKVLSLPANLLSFGLFGLVVNGVLLLVLAWVAGQIDLTFTVGGFPPDLGVDAIVAAVVGGVVLSIVSTIIGFVPFLNPSR